MKVEVNAMESEKRKVNAKSKFSRKKSSFIFALRLHFAASTPFFRQMLPLISISISITELLWDMGAWRHGYRKSNGLPCS